MASTAEVALTSPGPAGPTRPSRYEAPFMLQGGRGPDEDRILGWIRESVQEGEHFLKGQSGYRFVDTSHRIMADLLDEGMPPTLSKASDNFVKRDVRELVGMLANPRPIAGYKCDNPAYDDQAYILNKLYMGWYNQQFVDRRLREALQYAAVEGTGYLMMEWDPGYWTTGPGQVTLTPLGVDAVLPIQISPDTWDLQTAYAVVIRRSVPITHLMRRFPLHRDRLVPDGDSISRFRRLLNNLLDRVTPTVHNTYGQQRGYKGDDPLGRALVTVFDIYLLDEQINTSGQTIRMGQEGSPWEYTVPSMGQDLPTPFTDVRTGQPVTKRATPHDARLFPFHRHIVATRNTVLYDGPSRWWHGRKPLVKFRLDDWPFEYCGIPITKEPAKLQAMVTSLLRAKDDSNNARLRPPLVYDGTRVSPALARSFDPRQGGQTFELQNLLGEAFKIAIDPRYFTLDQDTMEVIQWARDQASELIGRPDLKNLQAASQIPSGDSIEKMTEVAGPVATDLSRNMESSLRDMGELFKSMPFEFYTAKRRFQLLGPDGLTREDFDYDPAQLVPLDIELPTVGFGGTRAERARAHMLNFQYDVIPNTVYEIKQTSRKLMLIQLARLGFPISPYTVMEAFDIPNPGRPPANEDGKMPITEIERFKAWKKEEAMMMVEVQMALTEAQMAMGMMQQQASPLGQLSGAIQQAIQQRPGQGPGRPPSGQEPPRVENKEGGTRSTISESG